MSRSYRKRLSDYHAPQGEYEPPYWGRMRAKERRCVHDEARSFENGYVVFPQYYWNDWRFSKRACYSKKQIRGEIRNKYFTEVNSILNGYLAVYHWTRHSGKEEFHRCFRKIKGEIPDGNPLSSYAWLNTKEAKKMIKTWNGEPLDVIYELARKGVIEKAARLECKKRLRK